MLVAGDVLGDVGAGAFGVAHLAEDTSARAGDAFDGFERSTIMGSDPIIYRQSINKEYSILKVLRGCHFPFGLYI